MKILMISSEALPFSKTGGLGDVLYSLTNALSKENDVKLIIPCTLQNLNANISPIQEIEDTITTIPTKAILYKSNLPSTFETYLIYEREILSRNGVYGEDGITYNNNCQRFSLFSRLALNSILALNWKPDIIHVHDWPTALIPSYLKCKPWSEDLKGIKTVFSIHNLGYQGTFSLRMANYTGLPADFIATTPDKRDEINFLVSALQNADKITTVSPTYSREILTELYSQNLSPVLIDREKDLSGILNGIDLEKWNPKTDPFLPFHYDSTNLDGKKKCKKAFLKQYPFKDNSRPLVAMISRLAFQKGINELFLPETGAIEQICKELPINIVVIGTGEAWCETRLHELTKQYSNFIGLAEFDESLSHLAEAASDFFLMPSVYEPCGLNQMYSSHYGSLPIVRYTGGLADTVIAQTGDVPNATGYTFYDLTPSAIFNTLKWALQVYKENPQLHQTMIENGMNHDFSWHKSAKEYNELYTELLS